MVKYAGSQFLLQVYDTTNSVWVSSTADRSTSYTVSNEQVDTTEKSSVANDRWRRLGAFGVRSCDVSCAGVLTNARVLGLLMAASIAGTTVNCQVIHDANGDIAVGPFDFQLSTFERTGEYNGAEMYNIGLVNTDSAAIPAPPAWTPAQLPAIKLWLKADELTTLINPDTGRLYANGDPVSIWPDNSGLTNSATSGTGTGRTQGQFSVNRLNGLPSINFSGVNSYGLPNIPQAVPMTIYIVMRQINVPAGNYAEVLDRAYTNNGPALYSCIPTTGITTAEYWDGAGGTVVLGFTGAGQPNIGFKMCSWYFTGSHIIVSENQVSTSQVCAKTNVDVWNGISNPGAPQQFIVGDINEIIICNSDLTGANQVLVETYLKAKWGL